MALPVIMPRQGQSVETCIIAQWYKKKGDKVNKGDILLSYETDKAAFEIEAPASGTILEIFYQDGEEVRVLSNIAVIGQPGESIDEFRSGTSSLTGESSGKVTESEISGKTLNDKKTETDIPVYHAETDEIIISPRARALAGRLNVPTFQSKRYRSGREDNRKRY